MLIMIMFKVLRKLRILGRSKDCNRSELPNDDQSNQSLQENRILSAKSGSLRKLSLPFLKMVVFYSLLISFPKPIEGSMDLLSSHPLISSNKSSMDFQAVFSEDLHHHEIGNISPRMLEEISKSPSKPVSLAVGKALSSLSISAYSIVLSKDKNTAFVSLTQSGAIKVVDVSNLENPTVVTTIRLKPLYSTPGKVLVLSNDEKTLFASNMRYLEIIDVSNFGLPVLLAELEDFDLLKRRSSIHSSTSMTLARDNKTLFVAGFGMQVIDVSDLSKPKIISSNSEEIGDRMPFEAYLREVKYCEEREILYLAGNKALNISDARDPRNLKPLGLYSAPSYSVQSVLISKKNNKEIFVLGRDEKKSQMILKKIDVSLNPEVIESYNLDYDSSVLSSILGSSSDENVLFFKFGTTFGIFNIAKNRLKLENFDETSYENGSGVTSIMITEDDSTIMMASSRSFQILELYKNYPNSRTFTLSQNVISSLNSPTGIPMWSLYLTSDEKVLFIQRGHWDAFSRNQAFAMDVVNVSDTLNPKLISSFSFKEEIFKLKEVRVFEKTKRAYLFGPDGIAMLDLSDLKKLRFVENFKKVPIGAVDSAEFSSDGSKGYIIANSQQRLMIIDLSDAEKQGMKLMGEIGLAYYTSMSLLTKKEDLIYTAGQRIEIYNVSNLKKPGRISSSPLDPDGGTAFAESMILSDDERTLFVYASIDFRQRLAIYDVHEPQSIKFLGSLLMPSESYQAKMRFSPDRKLIYLNGQYEDIFAINISNYTSPFIQGIFKVENRIEDDEKVQDLTFSKDYKTAIFVTNEGLKIASLEVLYTTYLGTENIRLGQEYSYPLTLFKMGSDREYEVFKEKFKFTKISLFDIKINPEEASPELNYMSIPNWITFEKENQMLAIEPKKQVNLGSYTLFSAFSTKIPQDVFMSLMKNNAKKNQGLVTALIIRGYLDDEMFLTSSFDLKKELILPSEYSDFQDQASAILQKYYFETWTIFDVLPSLDVRFADGKIVVNTLSSNRIRVDIKLLDNNGQFLKKQYGILQPIITEKSSRIVMEGSLNEVNSALRDLVVNLETTATRYDGTIVVWDHLNSAFSQKVERIDRLFEINRAPLVNITLIQDSIDAKFIYTGEYFTVDFQRDMFTDEYSNELSYEIAMEDPRKRVPEWMSFSNLSLHGTPPEEFFGREMKFYLIVRNEFKSVKEPFVLRVNISLKFVLKLLKQYCPYLLTMIGLVVYANKIYNIVCKNRYRYPKDIEVEVGEEINIPMIAFIEQEKREADFILEQLRFLMNKKLGKKSIKNVEFAACFLDKNGLTLDKSKLRRKVNEVTKESMINKDLNRFSQKAGRELILQLIFNQLCLWYLENDRRTKEFFDEIKGEWAQLVDWDQNAMCNVKEDRLNELFVREIEDPNHDSAKEKLISEDVNISLLKNVIEAHAMKNQHIDYPAIRAHIVIKEKVGNNIFKGLLKLDLNDIHFSDKGKMGYGMRYKIQNNRLSFYGVPEEVFKGRDMIVQITSEKHLILKELWLHGVSKDLYPFNDEEEIQEFRERTESNARGQEYEVY